MLTPYEARPSAAQVARWLWVLGAVGLIFGLASSALNLGWWELPLALICSGVLLRVLACLLGARRRSTRGDSWLSRL